MKKLFFLSVAILVVSCHRDYESDKQAVEKINNLKVRRFELDLYADSMRLVRDLEEDSEALLEIHEYNRQQNTEKLYEDE